MLALVEITFKVLSIPEPEPRKETGAWTLVSRLIETPTKSCEIIQQILGMTSPQDQKAALAALHKLIKVTATGLPLPTFYDKKQCHEIHQFQYLGKKRVIWRIWHGNIRLAFYYGENKLIYLPLVFPKREDRLEKKQQLDLQESTKLFIDAELAKNCVITTLNGDMANLEHTP